MGWFPLLTGPIFKVSLRGSKNFKKSMSQKAIRWLGIDSFLSKVFSTVLALGLVSAGTARIVADAFLFDFGADATQTVGGVAPTPIYWNNVPASIGADDFGSVPNLVTTNNVATDITLQMVSRFNGANENGTTTGNSQYPVTATRDSLFGNTELFSGLENLTPILKLTGLSPSATYTVTFYASRTGVTDNRETRYTVTGATETTRDLNVANNITNSVSVSAVAPDANGEITIALAPGPNNNNANHFVYLGVLQIDPSTGGRILVDFGADGTPTDVGNTQPSPFWNNITATIGTSATAGVTNLVTTNGTASTATFQMVSRFNGANANGATTATVFPTTATQDSLFGNTEAFSGLANIKPAFKLTGLDPANVYSFTFYGSRTGVTDNRETRYTVTGTVSASADLNAANNTNNIVSVSGVRPTAAGEVTVELNPGPNNNNANHFTYLGAMRVEYELYRDPRILIDFGAEGRPTTADPDNVWNNVGTVVGGSDTGSLSNLVLTGGSRTPISLQMISRFNGANENGTEQSGLWILDATRDSLFGNTELFSGLENVTPIFKLSGLVTNRSYKLTLYASRLGVGDNRETHYTVTGATEKTADLNVANNETDTVVLENVLPDAAGEVRIALTPGANNDNGNHFVYLGVLQLDWATPVVSVRPTLSEASYSNGSFRFKITGTAGKTYKVQRTSDFAAWNDSGVTVSLTGTSNTATVPQTESHFFYRVVEQ